MRIFLIISFVFASVQLISGQNIRTFKTKNFEGQINIVTINDSTKEYRLDMKNVSNQTIYLLKNWTGFSPMQNNNPEDVYFELTFPQGGDIFICSKCDFELYKIEPQKNFKLGVIKISDQSAKRILIEFDQIILDEISDQKIKTQLMKSDKKGKPQLSFKYYFETAGLPKNGDSAKIIL